MSRDDMPSFTGGTRREEYCENELQRNPDEFGGNAVNKSLHTAMDAAGVKDGTWLRGVVLHEAMQVINGERQDVYGNPEDSFALIGEYWGVYLRSKGYKIPNGERDVRKDDVAMLMSLFKHAREAFQHKRDNVRDATGYLGIYADMQGAK